jgi:predicted N-formylglutamate amidohydrolase
MRYSDGAIVPGNAGVDAPEVALRRERYWTPYRETIAAVLEAMIATGEPPALLSLHSFTPVWRGTQRRWKVGVLWDRDDRVPGPLLRALHEEPDLGAHGIGDNEPYDGALAGDTIDSIATARGLANALIEIRQDLIAEPEGADAWADRLARLLKPILADRGARVSRGFGSRARRGRLATGPRN